METSGGEKMGTFTWNLLEGKNGHIHIETSGGEKMGTFTWNNLDKFVGTITWNDLDNLWVHSLGMIWINLRVHSH